MWGVKRFVVHFYPAYYNEINDYAKSNNLTIITIAPMYGNGIFVLFEKEGEQK